MTPDLKLLIDQAVRRLTAVSEAVLVKDQPFPNKLAKDLRHVKPLVDMALQQVNEVRQAHKSAGTKKPK